MALRPWALGAGGGSLGGVLLGSVLRWVAQPPTEAIYFNAGAALCDLAGIPSQELVATLLARTPDPIVLGLVAGLAGAFGLLVGLSAGAALVAGRRGGVRSEDRLRGDGTPAAGRGRARLEGYRCPE